MTAAGRDPITWRQIGVGYVILICIALGLGGALLDPHAGVGDAVQSMIAFAVLAGLYGIWKLAAPGMARVSAWLGGTPKGQLRLKRLAVAAMWVLSLGVCAACVRVTQRLNPW